MKQLNNNNNKKHTQLLIVARISRKTPYTSMYDAWCFSFFVVDLWSLNEEFLMMTITARTTTTTTTTMMSKSKNVMHPLCALAISSEVNEILIILWKIEIDTYLWNILHSFWHTAWHIWWINIGNRFQSIWRGLKSVVYEHVYRLVVLSRYIISDPSNFEYAKIHSFTQIFHFVYQTMIIYLNIYRNKNATKSTNKSIHAYALLFIVSRSQQQRCCQRVKYHFESDKRKELSIRFRNDISTNYTHPVSSTIGNLLHFFCGIFTG